MRTVILNAFSLNMLDCSYSRGIKIDPISAQEASWMMDGATSAVGHEDTARVFSSILGVEVACNRATVTLEENTRAIVGQYKGPRLPEGAMSLPEGASLVWCLVTVE
ncbi:DNA binding protein [uncultured Caudovirales phage]|uniref:DNA binding protein n=1 Tax=uncultured Caudovirales phage TaxID=2100421 RepID=A0A6J5KZ35_9CAUD|nr:DNA binding protein [uncultured Caudovirales phage]